jgi:hypothetical protein
MAEDSFHEFMQRIRAGDEQAADELVRRYESAIRMEVRMVLRMNGLASGRLFESRDICQSVLASFFVRVATGQYELDNPRRLTKLLLAMARRKLGFQLRKHRAERRDYHRLAPQGGEALANVEDGAPPDRILAGRELLERVSQCMTREEWQLVKCRAQGQRWAAIAAEYGGSAQARRKQVARALDRVLHELGLEDARDG